MRFAAVLAVLGLASCSGRDPVGVYAADPAAMNRAPLDPAPGASFARGHVSAGGAPPAWGAEAEVRADGSFQLEVRLASTPDTRRSGTWRWRGDELAIVVTEVDGQALPRPQAMSARLEDGVLHLRGGPDTPSLVLRRR